MFDVWLCWYLLEIPSIDVGRKRLGELVAELGLPSKVMTGQPSSLALTESARTRHRYTDPAGQAHTIVAEPVKRTNGVVTYAIKRGEDGYKIAEWKYFPNRLDRNGRQVPGTATTKAVLRRGLDDELSQHAQAWVDQAESTLAEQMDAAPGRYVSDLLRESIESVAVPIRGHASMWFAYEEGVDLLRRCQLVLQEVAPRTHEFTLIRLGEGERHALATSADVYLTRQLDEPIIRLGQATLPGVERPRPKSMRMFARIIATTRHQCVLHERRLRHPLPKTVGALAQAEDLMAQVDRTTRLPAPRRA